MIKYIGDLSKNDALVLKELAEESGAILEFGCGASTQILSAYSKNQVTSIDTSAEWIDKTISNIDALKIENKPVYIKHDTFLSTINEHPKTYDLIFVDGLWNLRKEFAIKTWGLLQENGNLVFHDTRRHQDIDLVCEILKWFYNEVDIMMCNYNHSNITIIQKKKAEPYENWQITEKK